MQRLPPILRDAVASTGIGGLLVRPRPPQGVAVVDRRPRRGLPAAARMRRRRGRRRAEEQSKSEERTQGRSQKIY